MLQENIILMMQEIKIYNLALSLYARYREAFGLDFELPEDGYHGQDIKRYRC